MLRLVHPRPEVQGSRTPKRKGRKAPALFLTPDERRHLRVALQNLRRAFGTWACLADAMGVRVNILLDAAHSRNPQGSPALAIRAAKVSGMTVEAILTGTLSAAGRCETCGHRIGDGRLVAAGGAS